MRKAMGVDIGGTKVAAAIIDEQGRITHRVQVPSDTSSSEAMLECVVGVIDACLAEAGVDVSDLTGIGLGIPGKVDSLNGVAIFQNNIPWEKFPVVARLADRYAQVPIAIENDVKAAAYAEYRLAGMGPLDVFGYLTVSTGIACTNIVNPQIIRGDGFSGEIGFLPVPSSTGLRPLESVCAGPGIEAMARALYLDDRITVAQVFARALKGEQIANELVDQSAMGVAIGLFAMICLLDPKEIVIGGSVAVKNPFYVERIKAVLERYAHKEQMHILPHIRVTDLGGDNGIIGAGFLVMPAQDIEIF